jgi:hypothetical protein
MLGRTGEITYTGQVGQILYAAEEDLADYIQEQREEAIEYSILSEIREYTSTAHKPVPK